MDACMEADGRVGERSGKNIYQKGYKHGQAIQLLSVIMLHDLHITVCVCSQKTVPYFILFIFKKEEIKVDMVQL